MLKRKNLIIPILCGTLAVAGIAAVSTRSVAELIADETTYTAIVNGTSYSAVAGTPIGIKVPYKDGDSCLTGFSGLQPATYCDGEYVYGWFSMPEENVIVTPQYGTSSNSYLVGDTGSGTKGSYVAISEANLNESGVHVGTFNEGDTVKFSDSAYSPDAYYNYYDENGTEYTSTFDNTFSNKVTGNSSSLHENEVGYFIFEGDINNLVVKNADTDEKIADYSNFIKSFSVSALSGTYSSVDNGILAEKTITEKWLCIISNPGYNLSFSLEEDDDTPQVTLFGANNVTTDADINSSGILEYQNPDTTQFAPRVLFDSNDIKKNRTLLVGEDGEMGLRKNIDDVTHQLGDGNIYFVCPSESCPITLTGKATDTDSTHMYLVYDNTGTGLYNADGTIKSANMQTATRIR